MAQAQATSKGQRALLRFLATLSPAHAGQMAKQPSEKAALRCRGTQWTKGRPTEIVFLIPLVGRHHVTSWEQISARLAATLASFKGQTNPNWRVIICGQDLPSEVELDNRIHFLPFTKAWEGNDKWPKLQALVRHLPNLNVTSAYVMPFDADDVLHPEAVDHMLQQGDPNGYLIEYGYIVDFAANRVGKAGPARPLTPLRKPFWKLCGSCAAFRYEDQQERTDFLAELVAHEHRMFPYLARLSGNALRPLPWPAALYMLNHGENFGARRGRVGFKPRFVQRFEVTLEEEKAAIRAAFPAAFL